MPRRLSGSALAFLACISEMLCLGWLVVLRDHLTEERDEVGYMRVEGEGFVRTTHVISELGYTWPIA